MKTKLLYFLFLMFAAFSMKRKRTTASLKILKPYARRTFAQKTPMLGKNTWGIVHSFLLVQDENKFKNIHRSFSQFPAKYENISSHIKGTLDQTNMNWLFFKHFETQKIYAENITEINDFKETPLHCATRKNDVNISKAVIEAGVDIDAKNYSDFTALHFAARWNHLKIGKVLIEAGADVQLKCTKFWLKSMTALYIAEFFNHTEFATMLREKMTN